MNKHKRTLYVGNLDQQVNIETLKNVFIPFGDIIDVNLPVEQESTETIAEFQELQLRMQQEEIKRRAQEIARRQREETEDEQEPIESLEDLQKRVMSQLPPTSLLHKGYAFVEFEMPEDAASAMENLNRSELYGRVLTVNYSAPKNFMKEHLVHVNKAVWEEEEETETPLQPIIDYTTKTNVDDEQQPPTKRFK
ncbi:cyp10 [Acrasis kona]|uniref:Cyp10 n=1 Tax=Acrasis kona TaxID=1008807 RepID=A0AAW2ZJR2_9EUKA